MWERVRGGGVSGRHLRTAAPCAITTDRHRGRFPPTLRRAAAATPHVVRTCAVPLSRLKVLCSSRFTWTSDKELYKHREKPCLRDQCSSVKFYYSVFLFMVSRCQHLRSAIFQPLTDRGTRTSAAQSHLPCYADSGCCCVARRRSAD